jgi:hypothetical protein
MRLPITFARDEAERLHSIAYAAAIQTGAKGEELDEVTAAIFAALAAQTNRSIAKAQSRPPLRLVQG